MPDERAVMDQIGRYWDARVLGRTSEESDLEPELATTIERLRRLGEQPTAAARQRVWTDVLSNVEATSRPNAVPWLLAIVPDGDASLAGSERRGIERPPGRARWALAHLATAALILLTLVSSYIAFGPGRPARHEKPGLVPRVFYTPSPPDLHKDQEVAEFVWETGGGPDRPLGSVGSLTLDPEGRLWVADDTNRQFQIFDPDGRFLEAWRPSGFGPEQTGVHGVSFSVAFDQAGLAYVVNPYAQRIETYGSDRSLLGSWGEKGKDPGQFLSPSSIAIDQQGHIYVEDAERSDIQVFAADGTYLRTIGEPGLGEGQFSLRYGGSVAVDATGNVWVTDGGSQRVQKFSSDGRFLTSFGSYGMGEEHLGAPGQAAVDRDGRLFVTDRVRQRVSVFDQDGSFIASWGVKGGNPGEFYAPFGLALDGKGFAYVGDSDSRVQKFRMKPPLAPSIPAPALPDAATSEPAVLIWESGGAPDLPLYRPGHIAVDPAGNIWVVDGSRNAFQIFSPGGDFIESWGAPGSAEGEFAFYDPIMMVTNGAVAFDQAGNIYVADPGNQRIQKFGPDRSFVTAWGFRGTGNGQFLLPVHVAVDARGDVYVIDSGRSVVQVFDSNGTHIRTIGEFGTGEGQLFFLNEGASAVDPQGDVWVVDSNNHRLQRFAADGNFQAAIGGYGLGDGQFSNPTDIEIDVKGRIYVGDVGRTGVRVQVFSSSGEFLASWSDSEGISSGGANLALDSLGNIYVSDYNGDRIVKYALKPPLALAAQPAAGEAPITTAPVAELLWETTGPPEQPLDHPGALAIDSKGNVWLPHQPSNQIQIFSPDGEFLEAWGTPGSGDGQFDFFWEEEQVGGGAVAFDGDDNIYVVDKGNHRIQKFTPNRAFLLSWGEQGTGVGEFFVPESIAIDSEGRVYVGDAGRDDIQVFDSGGTYLWTIGSFGLNDGHFYFFCGSGLAFAPNGDLLVSEGCNLRLQRFSPAGEHLATFGGLGTAAGQLAQPQQIAVDAEGRVFVADYSGPNRRIQVLAPDGTPLAQWGQEGLGPVFGPTGLGIDGEGVVYVSDVDDDRLLAFRLLPPLSE